MTTAALPRHPHHVWTSAADPSGEQLRKALLEPGPTASRVDPALPLSLLAVLVLAAGVSRVLVG